MRPIEAIRLNPLIPQLGPLGQLGHNHTNSWNLHRTVSPRAQESTAQHSQRGLSRTTSHLNQRGGICRQQSPSQQSPRVAQQSPSQQNLRGPVHVEKLPDAGYKQIIAAGDKAQKASPLTSPCHSTRLFRSSSNLVLQSAQTMAVQPSQQQFSGGPFIRARQPVQQALTRTLSADRDRHMGLGLSRHTKQVSSVERSRRYTPMSPLASPLMSGRPGVKSVRPYQSSQPALPTQSSMQIERTPERPIRVIDQIDQKKDSPVKELRTNKGNTKMINPDRYLLNFESIINNFNGLFQDQMEASIMKDLQEEQEFKRKKEEQDAAHEARMKDLESQIADEERSLRINYGNLVSEANRISDSVNKFEEQINQRRRQYGMPDVDVNAPPQISAPAAPSCRYQDLYDSLTQVRRLIWETEAQLKKEQMTHRISCSEAEKILPEVTSLGSEHAAKELESVGLTLDQSYRCVANASSDSL